MASAVRGLDTKLPPYRASNASDSVDQRHTSPLVVPASRCLARHTNAPITPVVGTVSVACSPRTTAR